MKYTSLMPLNRFVDALPAESESVRALEAAARRRSSEDMTMFLRQFGTWAHNDERFQPLMAGNKLMSELTGLSKELSAIGRIGLEIVDYLASGKAAPADWISAQRRELSRFDRPINEVMVAGARPVKILLDTLAQRK